jgi:homoserine O-succinyltransferase/O-acetyltransferase
VDCGESLLPLIINDGNVPEHWDAGNPPSAFKHATVEVSERQADCEPLTIALVNNMPDSAVEDTESQFFSLLEAAAGSRPVHIYLCHLPEVPRGHQAQDHLQKFYKPFDQVVGRRFDGAIITGTEPKQHNLRDEPYWNALTSVFDWAELNTTSTVMSCLAAHASVLHSDGIDRNALPDKQFGVFEFQRTGKHEIVNGLPDIVRFPHSRWNEALPDSLISHGYELLDRSDFAGVNLFVKQKLASLFVYFQGHPEYSTQTLLKEYRRDVRRFLRQERSVYPSLPHSYFDAAAASLLADFQRRAELNPAEETMSVFPESCIASKIENSWSAYANTIYRNWLELLASQKISDVAKASVAPSVRA